MKLVDLTISNLTLLSHPTGVRGLKLKKVVNLKTIRNVAPHGGAWIETRE